MVQWRQNSLTNHTFSRASGTALPCRKAPWNRVPKPLDKTAMRMKRCLLPMLLQVVLYRGQFIRTCRTEATVLIDIHQLLFGI